MYYVNSGRLCGTEHKRGEKVFNANWQKVTSTKDNEEGLFVDYGPAHFEEFPPHPQKVVMTPYTNGWVIQKTDENGQPYI